MGILRFTDIVGYWLLGRQNRWIRKEYIDGRCKVFYCIFKPILCSRTSFQTIILCFGYTHLYQESLSLSFRLCFILFLFLDILLASLLLFLLTPASSYAQGTSTSQVGKYILGIKGSQKQLGSICLLRRNIIWPGLYNIAQSASQHKRGFLYIQN